MDIQHKIRDDISPKAKPFIGLTPLQMEFLIWPLEIMIETVKAVNKCFGGLVDKDYAAEYFKEYGMENDLTMANIILGKSAPDELTEVFSEFLKKIPKNQPGKHAAAEFILEKYGLV